MCSGSHLSVSVCVYNRGVSVHLCGCVYVPWGSECVCRCMCDGSCVYTCRGRSVGVRVVGSEPVCARICIFMCGLFLLSQGAGHSQV